MLKPLAVLGVLCLCVMPSVARAELCPLHYDAYAQAASSARERYEEGVALQEEEDVSSRERGGELLVQAAQLYEEAYARCPDLPSLQYAAGRVYQTLGECERAITWYARLVEVEDDAQAYEEDVHLDVALQKAKAELVKLSDTCARTSLDVQCAQPGVTIVIDEETSHACPLALEVEPGSHLVSAQLDGHMSREYQVIVEARSTTRVVVSRMAQREEQVTTELGAIAESVAARPSGRHRAWIGAGSGMLVIGAGLLVAGQRTQASLQDQADARTLSPAALTQGERQILAWRISSGVVGASGLAALIHGLFLWDASRQDPSTTLRIRPDSLSLTLTF